MITSKVIYKGNLRNELTHINSGETIVTDAPIDNHGKGEAFSPTDLAATSLATCMMTVMGIGAEGRGIAITSMEAEVTKIMVANPRKIGEIVVNLKIKAENVTPSQIDVLKEIGTNCPVALSLHPDVKQSVTIDFI
jgi:uncharacterized OsmC-like protein